ncbi:helix-turn-helix transcriptional regulator [Methylomonas rosea]|uniref:histidine kinase n=1 Tax=Methylomonas rosea TaxID=2952227 RepID=A0ABT1TQN0_9GAMM|nr:PAS domain S-box protein [Methylomonas sp. WSC-7]MCQ8116792.1 PAS domain S-box protein [Methylomonas sp. WSC-7]
MLEKSIGQSAAILNSDFIAIAIIKDRHIVWANAAMHRIFAYEPDELIGQATRNLFLDQDSYQAFGREAYAAIAEGSTYTGIIPQKRKDGSTGWYEFNISSFGDCSDVAVGAIVDRTASYQALQKLEVSESRYRSVVEDQTEVISRILPDGTFLFVNDVFCRVFGKIADELIGHRWHPAAHPDDIPMIEARLSEMSPDHPVVSIENRVYVAGGELRWMQFINRGFYDIGGALREIQSVGRDITVQREALTSLQASEERYRTLVETTSVVTWFCPSNGLHVAPQPAWMAFTGQTAEEMLGAGWAKVVHPDDVEAAAALWQSAVERGEPFLNTHRIRRHDGVWRWMSVRAVPIRDRQGRILEWMGMGQDVTEQKQAEMALAESEEQLEMALAASGLVLWDWHIPERKVTAGNRWFELLGYNEEELGHNEDDWMDLVNPKDLESFKQKISVHLQGETASFESEHRLRHKDGHWVSVEARGRVTLRDRQNSPLRMVGTILDISQRKRLNEEGVDLLKRIELLIRDSSSPLTANAENVKAAESLTKRQRQILGMIATGMTSAEIGKQLHLATPTVISHRRNLMANLGLHSTAEVTRFAIDHGLITTK